MRKRIKSRLPIIVKHFFVVYILLSTLVVAAQKPNQSMVDSLIKIAESYKEKDIDKSRSLSQKVLKLSLKLKYDNGTALAYKNLATLSMFQSDIRTAIDTYNNAIVYFKKVNSIRGIADCYNNIALAFSMNSKFDSSLIYYQKNLTLEEQLGDKVAIAETMENIGIAYYYHGYTKRAMEYFIKAATIFYTIKEYSLLYPTIVCISSVFSDLGYHRLSIRFHHLALIMAQHFENIRVMSTCYNNIGVLLFQFG